MYFVKYSTVDCKYLLFLQVFSSDQNQNSIENGNIADCLKKCMEIHKAKQITDRIFDDPYLTE